MEREGLYIAKGARVGGFGGFSERTIAIEWLRSGEGLGEVLVGCEERVGLRGEGRNAARQWFRRPKRPTNIPTISRLHI